MSSLHGVDKIMISPISYYDHVHDKDSQITFELGEESGQVLFKANLGVYNEGVRISKDDFLSYLNEVVEKIMSGESPNLQLEDHETIQHILNKLKNSLVLKANRSLNHFYTPSKDFLLNSGLGVAYNKQLKTYSFIFEDIYFKDGQSIVLEDIQSLQSLDSMEKQKSLKFHYFIPEYNILLDITSFDSLSVDESIMNVFKPRIAASYLDKNHKYFNQINQIIDHKNMEKTKTFSSENESLDLSLDRRSNVSRLSLLSSMLEDEKKMKMMDEFSDIEI